MTNLEALLQVVTKEQWSRKECFNNVTYTALLKMIQDAVDIKKENDKIQEPLPRSKGAIAIDEINTQLANGQCLGPT